jgi:hypothetical protein
MSVSGPPIPELLPQAFPWTHLLPVGDRTTFAREFAEVISSGDPAATLQLIIEWRHTADIYADPELLAALGPGTS